MDTMNIDNSNLEEEIQDLDVNQLQSQRRNITFSDIIYFYYISIIFPGNDGKMDTIPGYENRYTPNNSTQGQPPKRKPTTFTA